jgi:hypothetical protein
VANGFPRSHRHTGHFTALGSAHSDIVAEKIGFAREKSHAYTKKDSPDQRRDPRKYQGISRMRGSAVACVALRSCCFEFFGCFAVKQMADDGSGASYRRGKRGSGAAHLVRRVATAAFFKSE